MTFLNTIYSKYNRERALEFQIETIILNDSNGNKIVKKRPLSSKASMHIKNIYTNYFILKDTFKENELKVVPVELVADGVEFPFVEGKSVDSVLVDILLNKGKDSFLEEISKYYSYMKNLSESEKNTGKFISDEAFFEIFGERLILDNSIWFNTSNIDMTFDNLIINEDGDHVLIDYEWVFNIKVPLSFIMYRSISNFYIKHNEYIQNIIEKNIVFNHIGIDNEIRELFKKMESNFQQYVSGELFKYRIPSEYIQENISLDTIKSELIRYKESCNEIENEKKQLLEELNEVKLNLNKCNENISGLTIQNNEMVLKLKSLTDLLEEKEAHITNLDEELNDLEFYIKKLKSEKETNLSEKEKIISETQNELNLIKESHGYKFLLKYYKLRDNLLPTNTNRRQFSKLLVKLLNNPSVFMKQMNSSNVKKGLYYLRKGNTKSLMARVNNTLDSNKTIDHIVDLSSQSENYFLKVMKNEHTNLSSRNEYTDTIDVIVPIYNAIDFLKKCMNSVFINTDMYYNLFLLNDCSPDPKIYEYLEELKQVEKPVNLKHLHVIHNENNLGFVSNVNKGISLSKNHVVILNTDTEVPNKWLSRLMRPIFENEFVSSVTPFSNSATICSFPKFCEDNEIPKNLDVNSLDELFLNYGSDELITLPTGVGFCMALNSEALDRIGAFDAEAFGKGYGEENDWCMRAHQAGYKNVLVQNLFVYHKHGVSFSQTTDKKRDKRIEENLRKVEEKHPEYIPWVHRFIKEDPIKPVRDLLTTAAIAKSKSNKQGYLFINHSLGGGTQLYQDYLINRIKNEVRVYTLTLKNNMIIIEDQAGEEIKYYTLQEDELTQSVINNIVELLNIHLIYINQLVTFSPYKMMELIQGTNLKYICFLHDYYWVCPSYCLINSKEKYCFANTDITQCKKCIGERLVTEPWINMKRSDIDIEEWRESFSSFLKGAYKVISPSGATKEIINAYYPDVEIEVIEHELITEVHNTFKEENLKNGDLIIAFIGSIGEQKGSNIIYELKVFIKNEGLPIKIKVIGVTNIHQSPFKSEDGILEILGKYNKDDISEILEETKTGIVVIPALWPETYSYTTTEAIMSGYPVITFNIGAPAERVIRDDVGWVTNDMTSKSIIELLKGLNDNRDLILKKAKNIKKIFG